MSEPIALEVKDIDLSEHWCTDARLYRLDPPLNETDYVVSSAIEFRHGRETLVFAADEAGECLSWGELGGKYGTLDHAAALASIGYRIEEAVEGEAVDDE